MWVIDDFSELRPECRYHSMGSVRRRRIHTGGCPPGDSDQHPRDHCQPDQSAQQYRGSRALVFHNVAHSNSAHARHGPRAKLIPCCYRVAILQFRLTRPAPGVPPSEFAICLPATGSLHPAPPTRPLLEESFLHIRTICLRTQFGSIGHPLVFDASALVALLGTQGVHEQVTDAGDVTDITESFWRRSTHGPQVL